MENNNYPQPYPGFQYFPPPTAWIDPNSESYPNSESSDDCYTPTWVIVGAVVAVVLLCGFLFYYIQRREKKIQKKAALASASAAKSVTPPAKPAADEKAKKDPAPPKGTTAATPKKDQAPPKETPIKVTAPPPMGFPISYPGNCPACGHRGGLYSFSYTCPLCKYKMEFNVVYPDKK